MKMLPRPGTGSTRIIRPWRRHRQEYLPTPQRNAAEAGDDAEWQHPIGELR